MTGQPATAWAGAVRRWRRRLPACGLLLALATVFLFAGDRDYFNTIDDWFTAKNMALAKNLTARGLLFLNMRQRADGTVAYKLYGRFPIGAFVLIKLAIAPFEGDSAAQLAAARTLMLAFFCAAASLAYLALARLSGSRAVALGAVPCDLDDTKGRFYLHLAPADAQPAGGPEIERRDHLFYNAHGVIFNGKCLMRVALPTWAVATAHTGQFHPRATASWRTGFRLDVDRLRSVLRALRHEAPSARAAFDVYTPATLRGGTLRYMREPCTSDDVRRRFFLHVVPVAAAALPEARGGAAWQVELAPNAPADH